MLTKIEQCMFEGDCDDATRNVVSIHRRRDSDIKYCTFRGICTQQASKFYRINMLNKVIRKYGCLCPLTSLKEMTERDSPSLPQEIYIQENASNRVC